MTGTSSWSSRRSLHALFSRSLTPGPPPSASMNLTPAASSVRRRRHPGHRTRHCRVVAGPRCVGQFASRTHRAGTAYKAPGVVDLRQLTCAARRDLPRFSKALRALADFGAMAAQSGVSKAWHRFRKPTVKAARAVRFIWTYVVARPPRPPFHRTSRCRKKPLAKSPVPRG
jgi:hypothetical protein